MHDRFGRLRSTATRLGFKKKYRKVDEICPNGCALSWPKQKINDVSLCRADSDVRIRLARPDEMALYRQAAEANKSSDDKLVYLIELDDVDPSDNSRLIRAHFHRSVT